jgi:hypothetical protein
VQSVCGEVLPLAGAAVQLQAGGGGCPASLWEVVGAVARGMRAAVAAQCQAALAAAGTVPVSVVATEHAAAGC